MVIDDGRGENDIDFKLNGSYNTTIDKNEKKTPK